MNRPKSYVWADRIFMGLFGLSGGMEAVCAALTAKSHEWGWCLFALFLAGFCGYMIRRIIKDGQHWEKVWTDIANSKAELEAMFERTTAPDSDKTPVRATTWPKDAN